MVVYEKLGGVDMRTLRREIGVTVPMLLRYTHVTRNTTRTAVLSFPVTMQHVVNYAPSSVGHVDLKTASPSC